MDQRLPFRRGVLTIRQAPRSEVDVLRECRRGQAQLDCAFAVAAVLAEARRRGAVRLAGSLPADTGSVQERLRGIWAWISADERAPFVRLFFEVHADGLVHPESYPDQGEAITDWFDTLDATFRDVSTGPDDTVTPTLLMAVVRGLLFDLTTTGDRHRTDRALDRFAELLKQ
ncbi:hypothetical protein GXW83_15230 [Streptacidiphilus sp. PB12-B1b]|uniref:hypothetical protein n=1 Tax=Streptacidiphilus sp. PB12-B1b TaxID=2705012 RepID=UPI0015FC27A9|nr:hypothetical protein [Streptacidiphilus sp. PB12-B1b]QMU76881.1 hypothetical protein GXW83_15230 [Streptacidiphilus sp. PB12-B1b]